MGLMSAAGDKTLKTGGRAQGKDLLQHEPQEQADRRRVYQLLKESV